MLCNDKYSSIFNKEEEEGLLQSYEDGDVPPSCQQPPVQRKQKRPFWRRAARVVMTILALAMIWTAIAPFLIKCGHKMGHEKLPPNRKLYGGEDEGGDKPQLHYEFDKDLKTFDIKQGRLSTLPTRTTVYGKVILAAGPEKSKHITVDFDIHVSDTSMWDSIHIEAKEDGIIFSPDVMSLTDKYINVTAIVRVPHQKYQQFVVDVTQLSIKMEETFTMPIGHANFATVSGTVDATHLGKDKNIEAEEIHVKSVSGDIKGKYSLQNVATFETTSGNIEVGVVSYKANKDVEPLLKTNTVSGKTVVKFENHLQSPVKAHHDSVSGSISVRYPSDFQGKLQLGTTSGVIDVFGKGTKIIKKEQGILGKKWIVQKGHGESEATLNTISGNIEVGVGRQQDA